MSNPFEVEINEEKTMQIDDNDEMITDPFEADTNLFVRSNDEKRADISSFNFGAYNISHVGIDTCASAAVFSNKGIFRNYRNYKQTVKVTGGHVNAIGVGDVEIFLIDENGSQVKLNIKNAVHIPESGVMLLSYGQLIEELGIEIAGNCDSRT